MLAILPKLSYNLKKEDIIMSGEVFDVNINDYVVFKLTEYGFDTLEKLLIEEASEFSLPQARKVENFRVEDGSYRMQLHEFAFLLGRELYIGNKNIVEENTLKFVKY